MTSRQPTARLRVLMVTYALGGGGEERFASTMLHGLDRQRFEPAVVAARELPSYPIPDDVERFSLDKRRPWQHWRTVRRLGDVIRAGRWDVIVSTGNYSSRLTAPAVTSAGFGGRWLAMIGSDPGRSANWHSKPRWQYMDAVSLFVANSSRLAEAVVSAYPSLRDRVRRIGTPVDFEAIDRLAVAPVEFPSTSTLPVVLSVGRLHEDKRPDVLIEAFDRVRRRVAAQLWICGDGPSRRRVERRIRSMGLEGSVRLLGRRANPFALMSRADLFVMTSDSEGLPTALIEAQGCGLPAVSTRCSFGPDEIIEDGRTGLLTETRDVEGLAEAICELLSDPDRRKSMSLEARIRARRLYDAAARIRDWCDLIALGHE